MRNLFYVLYFLISFLPIYAQNDLGLKFYKSLVSQKFIGEHVKFDSIKLIQLADSIKLFVDTNKKVKFPEYCADGTYLIDLLSISKCFTGEPLENAIAILDGVILDSLNITDDEVINILLDKLSPHFDENTIYFERIYCRLWETELTQEYYWLDPLTLEETLEIITWKVKVLFLILHF